MTHQLEILDLNNMIVFTIIVELLDYCMSISICIDCYIVHSFAN